MFWVCTPILCDKEIKNDYIILWYRTTSSWTSISSVTCINWRIYWAEFSSYEQLLLPWSPCFSCEMAAHLQTQPQPTCSATPSNRPRGLNAVWYNICCSIIHCWQLLIPGTRMCSDLWIDLLCMCILWNWCAEEQYTIQPLHM